ncbi:hypothetical protein CYJ89_00165 [Lactobacillus jensenii]|jgi:hypothetical protein|uniref:hypothetical protein n=1 Tax=Lactobacillus jensenii TaxID=109790 RepID=UPI0002EB2569|nr:hypothetical protein [Lactobacillus jensenii]MCF1827118.1 hypothetical protein [Lactobacillus jensenii]MCF1850822.1 hypothetical protein [Lactobacillus jensenii]MCW8070717.1 hypothetical protein [Lactobacillus jensenii]MCZ3723768.1 hypothetical protein [Lactobacillus jensenii]MCZ3725293.1 hypothetical protein [Lactobacillus jensenii]
MGFIEFLVVVLILAIIVCVLFALLKLFILILPFILIIAGLIWLYIYFLKRKIRHGISKEMDEDYKMSWDDFVSYGKNTTKETEGHHRKPARDVTTEDVNDK